MTPRTPPAAQRARTTATASRANPAVASPTGIAPRIVTMRPSACIRLLERHTVGRMAYTFHNRVDIQPIHYVYGDGWLFARTSHGGKMTTIRHVPWVAFEVDEVRDVFSWKSVVVHGTVYTMERDGGPFERKLWSKGIAQLKRIVPDTGTASDPVPYRSLVFGIHVDTITGRSCSPVAAPVRARAKTRGTARTAPA